jgi:hypothetical protein
VKTFVTEFVLVSLFSTIPDLDFDIASSASSSFRLMLLILSEGSNRFSLMCAHFAFITALYGHLKEPSHSFDPFPILCNYLCIILVCFGSIVGKPILFLFLRSPIISSFWIKNVKSPFV